MKIAIDASQIIFGTGVSYYTESLIRELTRIDKKNQYILFGGSLRRFTELTQMLNIFKSSKVEISTFPFPPAFLELIWNRLHIFPPETILGKIDIFHSSDWTEPPSSSKKITTIHDLSPFKFPKFTPKNTLEVHRRKLRLALKEDNAIIAPSLSTKNDLVEFGFQDKVIHVIPEAASDEFTKYPEDMVKQTQQKYNLREKYLITIGVGGRKNTENLIKAYEYAKVGRDIKLVLVGDGGEKYETNRGVKALGRIKDNKELALLINGAEALVYPSLYEGFGLPILQAFACGCPVVTSDVSSMAEIAKGASILIQPSSVDSISEGITSVIKQREELIAKGFQKVKDYSWEKTAQETLKVYENLIS